MPPSPTNHDIPTSTLIPLHYLLSSPTAPTLHLVCSPVRRVLLSFPHFPAPRDGGCASVAPPRSLTGDGVEGRGCQGVGDEERKLEGGEADGEEDGGGEYEKEGVTYFTHASPDIVHTVHRVFLTPPNALDSSRVRSLVQRLLMLGDEESVVVNSYDPRIREVVDAIDAVDAGCDKDEREKERQRLKIHELIEMSLIPGVYDAGSGGDAEDPGSVFQRVGVQVHREEVAGEIAFYLFPTYPSPNTSNLKPEIAAKLLLLPSPRESQDRQCNDPTHPNTSNMPNTSHEPPAHRKIYISTLHVSPSHQRLGLATALLHYAIHHLPEFAGCEWVWTVFCENLPAVGLYQRVGARRGGKLWVVMKE